MPAAGRSSRAARRRALGLAVPVLAVCALVVGAFVTRASRTPSPPRGAHAAATHTAPARPPRLTSGRAGKLPAPVQDAAGAPLRGRGGVLLAGGLDSADVSVDGIERAAVGRGARVAGRLPAALHDAAAVRLGNAVYVFGGGEPSRADVVRVWPRPVRAVGRLPAAASDVGAAAVGGGAYVVGGYTGARALDTVVAWRPGERARVVARLPHGVRYAAVAAATGRIVIAGGTVGTRASRDVYAVDPRSGGVRLLARLPRPLTHAAAAAVGRFVYVLGGRDADLASQVRSVLAIDATTGSIVRAGTLPAPLSDAAAAPTAGGIVVAGGRDAAGRVRDDVTELVPR